MLLDILKHLSNNISKPDLFISTSTRNLQRVNAILSDYKNNYLIKSVIINEKNLRFSLTELAKELQKYEIIVYFPNKKRFDNKTSEFTYNDINFLLENLIGGQNQMMDKIFNQFLSNPKLGLVFADNPYLLAWEGNKNIAKELAQQLKLSKLPENKSNFPTGCIF